MTATADSDDDDVIIVTPPVWPSRPSTSAQTNAPCPPAVAPAFVAAAVAAPPPVLPSEAVTTTAPVVLVLCGVVGSGKTTLGRAIVAHDPDRWRRVCQDELGDRRACEEMTRAFLAQGKSVIIDRQNFDKGQRASWIEIAHRQGASACGIVLGTSYYDCEQRLWRRTDHPTVHNPNQAITLLKRFSSMWRPPTFDEGFDRLLVLRGSLPLRLEPTVIVQLLADLERAVAPRPRYQQQQLPFAQLQR